MKHKPLIAAVGLLVACGISVSVLAHGKTTSASNNQIMFEGTGSGTFNSQQMPFSFSVRCYGPNCVGAIAFPGAVSSVTYVTGTVTQLQQDVYMMSLTTPPAPTPAPGTLTPTTPKLSCSLANTPPIVQGENNTVTMTCAAPAGTGISQDAMVETPTSTN